MDVDDVLVSEDDAILSPVARSPRTWAEGLGPMVVGLVRAARRRADLSQRGLAARAGVHHGTVARIEAGQRRPSLAMFVRLLAAAGVDLVAVDEQRRAVPAMEDAEDTRDGGGRRYPAHLDVIVDPWPGEWWADQYGLARPPETFWRSRWRRDLQRRRSVWEVRVAQLRNAPPPPRRNEFYSYFL